MQTQTYTTETIAVADLQLGDVILTEPNRPETITRLVPMSANRIRISTRSIYYQQFIRPRIIGSFPVATTFQRVVS